MPGDSDAARSGPARRRAPPRKASQAAGVVPARVHRQVVAPRAQAAQQGPRFPSPGGPCLVAGIGGSVIRQHFRHVGYVRQQRRAARQGQGVNAGVREVGAQGVEGGQAEGEVADVVQANPEDAPYGLPLGQQGRRRPILRRDDGAQGSPCRPLPGQRRAGVRPQAQAARVGQCEKMPLGVQKELSPRTQRQGEDVAAVVQRRGHADAQNGGVECLPGHQGAERAQGLAAGRRVLRWEEQQSVQPGVGLQQRRLPRVRHRQRRDPRPRKLRPQGVRHVSRVEQLRVGVNSDQQN